MPKSTKTTGIKFSRIRHSKADYLKSFAEKNLKLAGVAVLSLLMGVSAVYAQPAANPPAGNVNPSFNNLGIVGGLSNPRSDGGLTNFPVLINDGLTVMGLNIFEGNLDIRGAISNSSAQNGGRVLINDSVDVRGDLINAGANNAKVRVNDSLEVTGNITMTSALPLIVTPNNTPLRIINEDGTTGRVGSFYTRSKTVNNLTGNRWESLTCRPNHQLISCSGYVSNLNTPGSTTVNHLGTTPSNDGTSTCNSIIQTQTYSVQNGAIRISNVNNNNATYTHTTTVTCFDPLGAKTTHDVVFN